MIRLDIFWDPICPWCYIGKTLLDRALESRPAHPFAIAWHPFQLNPDMPAGGRDRQAYLEAKFGGPERARMVYGKIAEAARAAGVDIDFERITRTPNTLDALRLAHWAQIEGKQSLAAGALFRAYFREGRDIGDKVTLATIAGAIGMDSAATLRLLEGDADIETIRTRDAHARARGINAVPTFIIADQHVLPGAQPVELWQQVIDEIGSAGGEDGQQAGAAPDPFG
ncbi:polyketide biosynthesis protein [Defluviimonas sp. 20V17]|uniref:Polyketide biosynthesis protein n=1 Tax=Allgaiera indica TaxID=765699 RepID=A0AAN4USR2_9RHOB|nr:DsbA family oxidoreductase [Allgaiera indica]KDB01771.1 polyketide biosynthesis protein [Defluviimonas sp. 20V17]GHE02478.1 polyketide biosynthesis protein [Allgaiera indica]SDX29272.1 Predicted dithiol-disulfide isomerase, DsbA family [Allgaiera indica]